MSDVIDPQVYEQINEPPESEDYLEPIALATKEEKHSENATPIPNLDILDANEDDEEEQGLYEEFSVYWTDTRDRIFRPVSGTLLKIQEEKEEVAEVENAKESANNDANVVNINNKAENDPDDFLPRMEDNIIFDEETVSTISELEDASKANADDNLKMKTVSWKDQDDDDMENDVDEAKNENNDMKNEEYETNNKAIDFSKLNHVDEQCFDNVNSEEVKEMQDDNQNITDDVTSSTVLINENYEEHVQSAKSSLSDDEVSNIHFAEVAEVVDDVSAMIIDNDGADENDLDLDQPDNIDSTSSYNFSEVDKVKQSIDDTSDDEGIVQNCDKLRCKLCNIEARSISDLGYHFSDKHGLVAFDEEKSDAIKDKQIMLKCSETDCMFMTSQEAELFDHHEAEHALYSNA